MESFTIYQFIIQLLKSVDLPDKNFATIRHGGQPSGLGVEATGGLGPVPGHIVRRRNKHRPPLPSATPGTVDPHVPAADPPTERAEEGMCITSTLSPATLLQGPR